MKSAPLAVVYSKPTRCIKCSVVNQMTHAADVDMKKGGWECANCGHTYLFAHWKIQKAGTRQLKV